MAVATLKPVPSGKGFKKMGIGFGVLLGLGILAYFVVSSSVFLKSVVLPRVGKSIDARITVDDLSLSPFSSLTLRGLKVETIGTTPLLTAKEVRVHYRLWALVRGNLAIDEVFLDGPMLQIVPTPDGKDNLQPVLEATSSSSSSTSSKRTPLDIHHVTVKDGWIRKASQTSAAGSETWELANVNLALDHLAAGKAGKLTISADPRLDQGNRGGGQGKLQVEFDIALDSTSFPQVIKGAARMLIQQATGELQPLAGFAPVIQADITPMEVKQLGLKFEKNGKVLGTVSAAGPFDSTKREGKLKLGITGIDRQVLNALGAASGADFGNTTVAGVAEVELSKGSTLIRAVGNLEVNQFTLSQAGRATPPVDFGVVFDIASDLRQTAVDQFEVTLSRAGQPALSMSGTAKYDVAGGVFFAKVAVEMVADRLFGSGPKQPVKVGLSTEGTFTDALLELKRLAVTLPGTSRADPNELSIAGRLERAQPKAQKGAFVIQATALDLTALYDSLVAAKPTKPAPASTGAGFPKVEPAATAFPFQPLTAELKLSKVFLGEVALMDAQGTLVINGGKLQLAPLRANLNGAPVTFNADLDFGVQGSTYDIGWQLSGVPIEPLANTFSSTMKGQAKGQLTSSAHVKGAGVTGASLKRSLSGQMSALVTNAAIQIVSGTQRLWFLPLDINLIASLLNIPEITRSPITHMELRAIAAGGKVNLQQALVQGEAFLAQAGGGIQFADILDNSPVQIPLDVSLSRALAQRANLLPAETPTNAAYAKLPAFASLAGTLGKVETKIDKPQLIQLTARAAAGLLGNRAAGVAGGIGNAVNNLGGLLTGQKSSTTNSATTNSATTNSSLFNPLNLFKKKQP